jgi:DNA polymerase-3 subunit epsilon
MLILGLDFETTFTDPIDTKKARAIEIGMVLWDTDRKLPVDMSNLLLLDDEIVSQFDDRITGLTGLTLADLRAYGVTPKSGFEILAHSIEPVDYIVAHNGTGFDKPLYEAELIRHGVASFETPWLDTCVDVPYPKKIETRKLDFLAPAHGFMNPFAHRAVFDVLSMLKVLSHYDIDEVIRRSTAPKVVLRAITRKPWEDAGKSNEAAKARGFRFDGASKFWLKTVLADEVAAELAVPGVQVEVRQ